ncbi:MAG: shikimate dehydrogenase [Bacteroidia bacterium]|nr:shikimate dehydrogenase [Bacteroidia bacterium]
MKTFGLIGFPLTHSFSQKYFSEKFKRENISDCEFKNFSLKNVDELTSLIKNNISLIGLSVTIPHKEGVMKFLYEVDDVARNVGAVNCIKVIRNAESGIVNLKGYNTDVIGFEESLLPLLKTHYSKALILGVGGAAKAVGYVLTKLEIDFLFVSRNIKHKASDSGHILYNNLTPQIIDENTLIINTTPVGMFPAASDCPDIPYQFLTDRHLLYDLIYNPEETLFLKKGKEMGAQTKNGNEMLEQQAEKSWKIWNS